MVGQQREAERREQATLGPYGAVLSASCICPGPTGSKCYSPPE